RRLRPPPPPLAASPSLNPRTNGELGYVQSLLPIHNIVAGVRLTSHLTVNAREFCELSLASTFCRSCPITMFDVLKPV
ncbi:hypothetical protein Leryth_016818, partial [Lithospermum erythrorhizon]